MSLFLLSLALADVAGTPHQYKDKETVSVDPAMATIVVRSNYSTGLELFRKVEAMDRTSWESLRQEAYAKAAKKYARALKTYETDIKMWNSGSSYDRQLLRSKPKKPDEVTLESIPMTPIELDNYFAIARKPSVAEDSAGMHTYIVKLFPGTYYLSGVPSMNGAIGVGTCFCMGTVGFTVRPGQLVDAGTITGPPKDFYEPASFTPPVANGAALPQLAGRVAELATIFPVGKMANFKATPVTRINAVPGVLGYNRDIPLDVASGNAPLPAVR